MNCGEARREIGQGAPGGKWREVELARHLQGCGECRSVREIHQDLKLHLGAMRRSASAHQPPPGRRADLLRTFAVLHKPLPVQIQMHRFQVHRWAWPAALAAGLILMVTLGPRAAGLWDIRPPALAEDTSSAMSGGASGGVSGGAVGGVSGGAIEGALENGEEGFMAVPYAPALASGELLRMLRTELYPAALVSLGVDIDPAWAGKMPAELLVGEDGYPRAVRVSADATYVF